MRRYNYDEDLDYSRENSVDDHDMRSYTPRNGYHNMDYDDRNWWQPEEEYEYESRRRADNDYDISEPRRHRHLRPLGIRHRADSNRRERDYNYDRRNYHDSSSLRYNNNESRNNNEYRNKNNNRYDNNNYDRDSNDRASRSGMSRSAWQRENDYRNEGYGGRNADDYNNDYYESGYYYNPDKYNSSDVRNDNEYVYKDYSDDDGTRRRMRWSDDYDYYQSVPSYRRSDDDHLEPQGNEKAFSRKNRKRQRMDEQDDERGKFSDRRHDFGYYADDRYDDYPRRRPNIRDSMY